MAAVCSETPCSRTTQPVRVSMCLKICHFAKAACYELCKEAERASLHRQVPSAQVMNHTALVCQLGVAQTPKFVCTQATHLTGPHNTILAASQQGEATLCHPEHRHPCIVLCGPTANLQPEPSVATLLLLLRGRTRMAVQICL